MATRNPFQIAGRAEKVARLVPVMLRSLSKFGAEATSKNVGAILRGLAPEVWRAAAVGIGIRPPSPDTIDAVILAVEVVYEDSEERDTELDLEIPESGNGFAPHDIAPASGVVWH